jgi:uncharacterized protein (DUF1501 family)
MKRRDFLKNGLKIGIAANALPVMLGGMPIRALGRSPLRHTLETASANNKNVLVIIQLQGGNDGLNCLIPFNNSDYKTLRPTLGLFDAANHLPALTGYDKGTLAFHLGMDGMNQLFTDGKLAILQNVGYPFSSLSHFRGTDIWNTGTDFDKYASTGWVGRLLLEQNPGYPPQTILPGSQPLAIQFGNSLSNLFLAQTGGMGIALNKVPTTANPGGHNYDAITSNATQYGELQYVRTIQTETEVYAQTIVDINKKPQAVNKGTYPSNNNLASQLSSIAKLIAGGMQTKIYMVTQGSYDTHYNQLTTQSTLLSDLSAAVAAFQNDLELLGIADQVAMMTYSEFGRRPQENGAGTDHGTAAPLFIMGTQVRGMVYGADPALDAPTLKTGNGNLTFEADHDFRNVYATVMNEWLLAGGDQTQVNADIQSVLTSDVNGTYSTTKTWQSLGVFKAAQGYVSANPGAPGLMLMESYPNPAHGSTNIAYVLPAAGPVELSVYNSSGVEVERLVEGWQEQGGQQIHFDAGKLRSGAYIYRLKTGAGEVTRQMIVEH